MGTLAKKELPIFFQRERFVDQTTFSSYSLNEVIDFLTSQNAKQYFYPLCI